MTPDDAAFILNPVNIAIASVGGIVAGVCGFFTILRIVNWIRHGHPDGSFEERYARGEAVEGDDFY